jgi:hypothetical protein
MELTMRAMFWILIAVTLFAVAGMIKPDNAMSKCQKTHSYDTCFQQLNR